jgi:hypothetical protein
MDDRRLDQDARVAGTVSAVALDRHVDALCDAYGVVRLTGSRGRAEIHRRGGKRTKVIRIPPVRGQVTYFVALHELGHLVGPGRSGRRLEKEAAAWRWALTVSLVQPTDACRRRIGKRLRSYLTWAERCQHRRNPPALPSPDSPFRALLAFLEL